MTRPEALTFGIARAAVALGTERGHPLRLTCKRDDPTHGRNSAGNPVPLVVDPVHCSREGLTERSPRVLCCTPAFSIGRESTALRRASTVVISADPSEMPAQGFTHRAEGCLADKTQVAK